MGFWSSIFGKKRHELSAEERHACLSAVQFRLIPYVVSSVNKGKLDVMELLDTKKWEIFLKSALNIDYSFKSGDFRCQLCRINDNYDAVVYMFPKPLQMPEAAYGIVLIDNRTKFASYYTLEMSINDMWVIGAPDISGHLNYGTLENPDFESFFSWVKGRMNE